MVVRNGIRRLKKVASDTITSSRHSRSAGRKDREEKSVDLKETPEERTERIDEYYRVLHETLLQDYDVFSTDDFYALGFSEAMNMVYASKIRRIDRMYEISMAAWRNHDVTSTKTTGKGKSKTTEPVYKTFTDFYNYEERLDEARGVKKVEEKVVNAFDPTTAQALMHVNSLHQ